MKKRRINLYYSIFFMEWRNILSYRIDFWITFIGSVFTSLFMAYFLWDAIFTSSNKSIIGGYNFREMMFYYLLAPLAYRATTGQLIGFMFRDIYEGSLNKYLLYPISFIKFKLVNQFAKTTFYLIQFFLMILIYSLIFKIPSSAHITLVNSILFIITIYLGSYLYFAMASCFEMVAFWADNVWSLTVMLRFFIYILGGMLLPISVYPSWGQNLLGYLPFISIVSFPIKTFKGELTLENWLFQFLIIILWSTFFTIAQHKIWKKGSLQYSGVGI